jgi:mannose-6-phosphate isomerase
MIRFNPLYQALPWGGRKLASEFDRVGLPDGPVGESWELVDLDTHASVAISENYAGATLGELWRSGVLGGSAQGEFPFLLKWIDAAQRLSVQVHPDSDACARLGSGSPKTEAWYVVHADPEALLMMGHYPGLDKATLRHSASIGTLPKWLYEVRPRPGEMYLIKAGTIHAIGAGCLLLEVQQPSKTTFRLYDWGRVGNDGQPRQLHLDEACESVHYNRYGAPQPVRGAVAAAGFSMRPLRTGAVLPPDGLRVIAADGGSVRLKTARGDEILHFGDVAVAEPSDGPIEVMVGTVVVLGQSPL